MTSPSKSVLGPRCKCKRSLGIWTREFVADQLPSSATVIGLEIHGVRTRQASPVAP